MPIKKSFLRKKLTQEKLAGADDVYVTKKGAIALKRISGKIENNRVKYKSRYSYFPSNHDNQLALIKSGMHVANLPRSRGK